MLWKDIFVAPIVEDNTMRKVDFPSGNDWVDWFDSTKTYKGGSSKTQNFTFAQFPVYHRKGSILPMIVKTNDTNHGDERSSKYLTVLIHPSQEREEYTQVRRWRDISSELSYTWRKDNFTFKATAHHQPILILLRSIKQCPQAVYHHLFDKFIEQTDDLNDFYGNTLGYYCNLKTGLVYLLPGPSLDGVMISAYGLNVY